MTLELTEKLINSYLSKEYYQFGSSDSLDMDIVILVNTLPSIEECKVMSKYYKDNIKVNDKPLNLNLCVVNDGIIINCHKGSPDEMNNTLYITFEKHEANKNKVNPIDRLLERNIALKVSRCIRICLSLLSKSIYRSEIKKALNMHDFAYRSEVLSKINFTEIPEEILTKETLKAIAFQLGQTLCLIEGLEVYTKNEIILNKPSLASFIKREDLDNRIYHLQVLNEFKNELLSYLDFIGTKKINQTVNSFYNKIDASSDINKINNNITRFVSSFINQKIDLKKERIV
ncbi:MAG: hypothetical protein U0457_09485 [Candidatus Sericytochromatia bacterium]